MGRIACILVAEFPLAALMRANPEFAARTLALAESLAPHAEIAAVSTSTRATGVRRGMTIAQARALAPTLTVVTRSAATEDSAASALADVAESISPVVETGAPGCVWLDLGGMERVYPDEDELAGEMLRRVRRVGLEASIGIAANRDIAHLAARCGGMRVIAPGLEQDFLNWLPLDLLGLGERDQNFATALARLGIKRLGDLARFDPRAIGTRFGRSSIELMRLVAGGDSRPLMPRRGAETFAEAIEFDYGVEHLEMLNFVLRPLLERIIARLELRGLAGGDMLVTLGLAGHRVDSRRVAVVAASNNARAMLVLINLNLEAVPPDAAIEALRVEVEPRNPRPMQSEMFAPPVPPPHKLQGTIARLTALCGPANVGMLRAGNSHRPEAVEVAAFDPSPAPSLPPAPVPTRNLVPLVLRALRPALEVEVLCACATPTFVRGNQFGGRVVALAGPWRRDGEWWRGASGFARDYYEFALDDGGVYRAFRDLTSARWYIDGVFD